MRYYSIREQTIKQCFQFVWKKSFENLADYFTKHFSEKHRKNIHSTYVTDF